MGSAWWQCAACLRTQEEDICELQLNHCNLYDVPPDVFIYERTLEKLYLDANRIKDLPRPLFQCHELRVLSLSDNEVSTLPPAIASLINLEYLDLSKNNIKELPDSIKECKNLRSIDISVNPFERFPDAITHIVGLRELYINDAYIEYLPANFGRLSALRTLELRENNMMTLPKSMSRLVNLQRLDIGNNDFTELPEVVGDLTNLTELWIDGNEIRRIPVNIEQLVRLNHFDCTMNAVQVIPSEIRGWRDISIMNFSTNEICQLPDSLCYLRTVVTLKIDDNQLNTLPDDIGQMSSLEELIVTKNFLEYLPASLGLLRKLHCLNADNNYLRCLPPEIGSCTALSLLSLRSNNLSSIPPELGHLGSLRVLNLVNNCIKFLPVSMLNLTNLKALWLSDNQSQPLVPLQQDFNSEEDMMVLSCFMLPQKPRQDFEQMDQPMGPISGSIVGTGRRICFAAEVESELPRQLHRAPTPYPKELRNLARHARNLHHQTHQAHDQRSYLERETMIKEAVVAKATAALGVPSTPGALAQHNQSNKVEETSSYVLKKEHSKLTGLQSSPCGRVMSADDHSTKYYNNNGSFDPDVEVVNSDDSSDEANKTVLAKEKSPDIREAKCIKNPSSEYLVKQPTVADYVNSTWKPDEYSKTNTAKIVESEKLAEPYKGQNIIVQDRVPDAPVVPQVPPPYHIAAAFSKKAALFQQLNRNQGSPPPISDKGVKTSQDVTDSSQSPPGEKLPLDASNPESDRSSKPSRIPVLRGKHLDGSISDNESQERCINSLEDFDRLKILSTTSIPTSPITGKKYRSPLSLQPRLSDRSKRILNSSNGSNGSSSSNLDMFHDPKDTSTGKENRDSPSNRTLHVNGSPIGNKIQSESNSGRSTPVSVQGKGLSGTNVSRNVKSKIPTWSDSPSPESKPRLKWMFGPHKNANVLPVRVRKNPGLGFSIAGGVAGAETGIIVTKVNPDGPAQGTLRPGDKILEVDGIDFTKADHDNAVAVLRSTGAVVSMMISRHP